MKILIIGQAPPAVKQQYPYDTTMLYEWLNDCGISKEGAQQLFEFEAMTNKFPGFDSNGGHKKPTPNEMNAHFNEVLEGKIKACKSIILLGNVPKDYFIANRNYIDKRTGNKPVLYLIHPSKRNYALYQKNKESVLKQLKGFIQV